MDDTTDLWVLCWDQRTYDVLSEAKLRNLHLVACDDFEARHPDYKAIRSSRKNYEYYWTCKARFIEDVLHHNPAMEQLAFFDADHYCFSDPSALFDEMGDVSILLIEHNFTRNRLRNCAAVGRFNAGLCVFRNDSIAHQALSDWGQQNKEWCKDYPDQGRFGDQKYLDDWPEKYGSVSLIHNPEVCVAPWNIGQISISQKHKILLINNTPLVFFHFHKFRSVNRRVCEPDTSMSYPFRQWQAALIFYAYAQAIEKERKILAADFAYPSPPTARMKCRELFPNPLAQRSLLVTHRGLSIALWRFGAFISKTRIKTELNRAVRVFHHGNPRRARTLLHCLLKQKPWSIFHKDVLYILLKTRLA